MGEPAAFALRVRVYYEDTDTAGIVYYANYLRFMERARTEWLRQVGFEHGPLRAQHGVVFTVARVEVDYRRPARLDDLLEVSVAVAEARRASFTLDQRVTRAKEEEVLCRGRVRVACVDADRMRPRAIPEEVITELSGEHRSVTD